MTETSAAMIQKLLHLNSSFEQKLEGLSEQIASIQNTYISVHDTEPLESESVDDSDTDSKEAKFLREKSTKESSEGDPEEPMPNSDTKSAGDYQEVKLMEKFNKMLVDCVFFALPQVLIFFPRYKASEEKADQRVSLMAIIQGTDNQSNEKTVVILFFVMFISVWLLGLVLSMFGRGRRCTAAVSLLTLWTVGSTVAFIDYMLCKCLPEDAVFTWLFRGHFLAMVVGISYIWFTYVRVPKFPLVQLPSFQPRLRFPSFQLPSFQPVFDLLRRWCQGPAPAVVLDDAKADDEFERSLLQV